MLNFAVSIIRGFTVSLNDTRFAIVKFSSSAKVEAYLNTFDNTQDLIEYVPIMTSHPAKIKGGRLSYLLFFLVLHGLFFTRAARQILERL